MSITKVDGLDSLFSRRVILNKSANAVADRMPMSSSNAKFCAVAGWHSYSLLKLKEAVKASDSVARRKRIANIYRAYACAADYAAVSTPGVKILEIQGEIIHFFLPFGQGDESKVIVFARKFNALVEDYVYSKYEDDIRQFHQAAQFGNSILISKDAPNGDGAAYSIVSLGPCANNPAKRIGKSKVGVSRPLWLPNDDGVTWRAEECATDQEVVQNKALYANDQRYRDFVDVMDSMIEPEDGEPSESGFEFKDVYFFRADMDGFTNKVKKAFEDGDDAVRRLAEEFASYMEKVAEWQKMPNEKVKVLPHSWAGDCCNMAVQTNECSYYGLSSSTQTPMGIQIVRMWETFAEAEAIRNQFRQLRDQDTKWVYSIAKGTVSELKIYAGDRSFLIALGEPPASTEDGVNLDANKGGYLVMTKEDVANLPTNEQETFKPYDDPEGAEFKYQDQQARKKAIRIGHDEARKQAERKVEGPYILPQSKPYWEDRT